MGITNRDGALYFATGIDNTGLYKGKQEAIGIIKSMMSQVTSFDVFGGIGGSAGIAFAQAAKHSYEFSKEYDKNMREVMTISAAVQADFDGYKQKVIDMTTEIPVAAAESAKALYQIVSAGHDGADGMKILETSAKAALGGVTDTATAADAITTILNAYKLDASEAEKISDQLFTTVRLGKTTFGELGRSIAQAAPLAAAYGVEIDQVLAAVATLTKSGTPTAQAMTQIRASIVGVSKVLGDGAFATRTYQEALLEVSKRAAGSESKLRALVPEIEAVNGVLGMTGINAKSAVSDLEEMNNSLGATADAYKKMADSADAQLQLLSNNVIAYLRPMGEKIMETVSDIAEALNEAFDSGDAQESLKLLGELVVTVTAAFIAYKTSIVVGTAAKKIYMAVLRQAVLERKLEQAAIASGIMLEKTATAGQLKNIAVRKILTTAIKTNTAALAKNAAAMLTNPYVLAAAAITALGYSIYKMATYTTDAEKAMKRVADANKEFGQSVSSEQIAIDRLFGKLKAATEGTKEYDKAKKAIISKYGQYLDGLDEEVKSLKKVEEAYKAISEAAIQAARDRAIDSATSKATEAYVKVEQENLEKIRDLMEKEFGALQGTEFFEKFKKELLAGNGFSEEIQKVIKDFDEKVKVENYSYIRNPIIRYVNEIKGVKGVLKTELNRIDSILGNHSPEMEPDLTYFERLTVDLKIAEEELENMKRASSEVSKEQIAGQETYIAKLKEAMAVIREAENVEEVKAKKSIEQYDAEIKKLKELQAKTTSKKGYKDENGDYIPGYDDYQKQINDLQRGKEQIIGSLGQDLQKIKDAKKNQLNLVYQLELEIEQARINAMQEGEEKYMAERALALKRDLMAAKERGEALVKAQQEAERVAWEEANKGKSDVEKGIFKPKTQTVSDLPKEQQEKLRKLRNSAYETFINTDSEYYRKLSENFLNYAARQEKLEKDYQKKIKALCARGYEEAAKEAESVFERELSQLNAEKLQNSKAWKDLFTNLDYLSVNEIEGLIREIETMLASADLKLSPVDYKALIDSLNEAKEKIIKDKPFQSMGGSLLGTMMGNGNLEDKLGGLIKSKFTANGQGVANMQKISGSMQKMQGTISIVDAIVKGIHQTLSAITDTMYTIADYQDSIGHSEASEKLQNWASSIEVINNGVMQGLEKLKSGDFLGATAEIVSMPLKFMTNLNKIHDKKIEKRIQSMRKEVEALQRAYDKLDKTIDKAYSSEKVSLIDVQEKNLKNQQELLRKQIQEENDKKKTDNDKITEWQNQIEDLNDEITEMKDRRVEAIMGKDIQSAIDDFASAYADAWAAGEDKRKAIKDVVRDMIKGAVIEMIKMRMNPEIKRLMEYISKAITDGIDANEQSVIDKMTERIYQSAEAASAGLEQFLQDPDQIEKKKKESGLQGAVRKELTEETGSELTGLFRSYYDLCKLQLGINTESLEVQKSCRLDVIKLLEVAYLIEHNTSRTVEELEKVNEELGLVRYNLQKPLSSTQTARSLGV